MELAVCLRVLEVLFGGITAFSLLAIAVHEIGGSRGRAKSG